jgi:hypothetical protein
MCIRLTENYYQHAFQKQISCGIFIALKQRTDFCMYISDLFIKQGDLYH